MLNSIYKIMVHRYLISIIFLILIGTSLVFAQEEAQSLKLYDYQSMNPGFVDMFYKSRTAYLYKGDRLSKGPLLKLDNKLRKQKKGKEISLIEGHLIIYKRYNEQDIFHPVIISFEDYKKRALVQKARDQFTREVVKKMKRDRTLGNYGSRSWTVLSKDVGGTNLSLNIDGNISISGQLIFENKDLVNLNSNDNKSWDLDINQTQRFNVEGNIGDKLKVKIKQDSEADFDWQNNMIITYEGDDNEIVQEVQAGNISLNLPSTQFVNVGSGKSEGLFGIKMVNQFGPLKLEGIASYQEVKKSSKKFSPGESSDGGYINDYNFIKDRYFFIDNEFKRNFYPLDQNLDHIYAPNYVIYKFEVFKRVTSAESGIVSGVAYIDPFDSSSYKEEGSWIRLENGVDYEISQTLGYIRFKTLSSQDVVGISYEIGKYSDSQQQIIAHPPDDNGNPHPDSNQATVFYDEYFENLESDSQCSSDGNEDIPESCKLKMKLIKAQGQSTPNSPTWPLMFKNVYSLGGSNINIAELELDIVYIGGNLEEQTHSQINDNKSFLHLFGLDTKDQNGNPSTLGDGKVDQSWSIVNPQYGELVFPNHLPFAYQTDLSDIHPQWGTNIEDIGELLSTDLDVSYEDNIDDYDENEFTSEASTGPAMYYSTNNQAIIGEYEFAIKVKHSQSLRSSNISLGFMIVEGSEVVRLNGSTLVSGTDYTIDYFTGTLNIINQSALDPTANLEITYEENELLSFDEKILSGIHFKYDYSDNDYLSGGFYYYNQKIANERVDFGFEPMKNFIWNISGKYDQKVPFLTELANSIPLVETNKVSNIFIEGEYATVSPNPNPIGQAFLDDFESSKRTSSPSIMQRHWKKASVPILDGSFLIQADRGDLDWYNPFIDVSTQDIWPQQDVSTQAKNSTTKTLQLQLNHSDQAMWSGVSTSLYSSDFDQSQSKYLDIWINADSVEDDNLILNIDIGYISEDMNGNGTLDTEDEDIYGPGLGDGILDDSEDIGLDGCVDQFEDGVGGCLIEPNPEYTQGDDPNNDNWSYEQYSNDYSQINGTEGNGLSTDYRYPDTEDLDNDKSLDTINDYFTYSLNLSNDPNLENQTYDENGDPTGWKLYRILLSNFLKVSESADPSIDWDDVRSMRLWTNYDSSNELSFSGNNLLKIAKVELVGNEWKELGVSSINQISEDDFDSEVSDFAITVINTQDNSNYEEPPGVLGEYDEINNIREKEQSLVLDFYPVSDQLGGIDSDEVIAIKKVLTNLSNDNKNNFFAYNFMEMFVYGNPLDTLMSGSWFSQNQESNIDLFFRLGKDDEFYELRQPIFSEWNSKNHVQINIDELTKYKLNIESLDEFDDTGIDGVFNAYESGCFDENNIYGGYLPEGTTYSQVLAEYLSTELGQQNGEDFLETFYSEMYEDAIICGPVYWQNSICNTCDILDPNGDNWYDCDIEFGICEGDEGWDSIAMGNGIYDNGEVGSEGNQTWEPEEPLTDYNSNDIFDYPAEYDSEQDIWYWDTESPADISEVCYNCTEFIIKGKPAINRIEYIIVGAINKSEQILYGKIFLDELRLTGVKKEKGEAIRFKGSANFADLFSINTEYKREDADFHRLEERLGTGDSNEYFSFQTSFSPDIILPSKWGVKMPLNLNMSSSIKTPKYYPNQPDILTASENQSVPDSIKTISRTVSLSSSFNKTTKSDNWIIKSTLDPLSLSLSTIQKDNSSVTIRENRVVNTDLGVNYSYSFNRDNYIRPFKSFEKFPFVGAALSETKIYYSPEKFSTSMKLSESEENKEMRTGIATDTYNLGMNRSYVLNYKITDNIKSNYKKNITSDIDFYMDKYGYSKKDLLNNPSSGIVQSLSEDLNNSFSPDILDWLDPSIKYNPNYTWNISNQTDENPSANIENSTRVEGAFNFDPKKFVGIFYKPTSSNNKKNSRRRGRKQSSSKKESDPILKIENETLKGIFDDIYNYASSVSKISFKYTYNAKHRHSNIRSDQFVDYKYRLGLAWTPEDLINSDNGQISGYLHDFDRELRVSVPTITVIPNLSLTSIEFKSRSNKTLQSTSSPDSSRVISYLPLGIRGDKGIPMISWGLTWSGFEKNEFIREYFKSFKLSHNYKGEMSESFINDELQRKNFKLNFSPLIKLDSRTKGKNPIRFEAQIKYSLEILNEGTTTEREYVNEVSSKLEFSRSDGISIPFFGELSNNVSFSLNVDWENRYKLLSAQLVQDLDDFNLQSKKTTFSFRPNISYNFSKYVNGTVFYKYILENDLINGRNNTNDFGFTINIKIQG